MRYGSSKRCKTEYKAWSGARLSGMVNGFTFEAQQNSSNHDTRMDYWAHGMNSSRPNGVAPNSFYGIEEAHVSGSMPGWTKPPLPKRKESLAHSDSDLSAPQDDDSGSDFDVDHPSDSSDYLGSRKRKRTSQKAIPSKFQHVPQDNDMRRKLRGAAIVPSQPTSSVDLVSQHNTANGFDSAKDRVSETEDEGSSLTQEAVEADPLAVPERVVSDEQLERERTWLKTSWEFVTILDFLSTFQSRLNFGKLQFSTEELESALILNNGTSGLLVEVHLALIKGISARSGVHPGNWTSSFAEKLRSYWRLGPLEGRPPFSSQRRYEAPAYAILPLADRVSALRILCELRLEKEDLHDLVETALYPPKKTKAEKRAIEKAKQNGEKLPAEEPLLTMDDVRKAPTAKDGSGLLYWYLDYHNTTGTRLYREVPQNMLKSKAKKEAEGPEWELIATSAEDLTEVGEKLKRSKKPADQALADMILEEFVPELLQRREADLRKQRAAAKLQAQLQNIMPEGGRSRRARKVVDYSYDAFDATIKAALRTKDADLTSRVTRSNANPDFRPDAVEDLAMGRRRGRSARAASPPGELPPFKRVRKLDEDSGSYGPSAEPSRMYSGSIEPSAEPSREATPGNADVGPNRQEIEQTNGRVKEQDRTYEQTGQKLDRQYQANAEASNVQPNGHFHSIEAGRQVYNEGHGQMYIQATYPGEYAQNEPYDRTSLDYQIPGVQVQHYGNQYDTYSAYYQDPQILWGNEQMQDQYGNIIPSQYTNSLGWQAQH